MEIDLHLGDPTHAFLNLACILAVVALWPQHSAFADLLYDNGAGGASNVSGANASDFDNSFFGVSYEQAAGFELTVPAWVEGVTWTGVYTNNNPVPDNFSIQVFEDNNGLPSDIPVFVANVGAGNRAATGFSFVSQVSGQTFDVYQYSATVNGLTLNADTIYWLSIVNATFGTPDDWGWANIPTGNGAFRADGGLWETGDLTFDFQLSGQAIPEPSSAIGLGLLAIGAVGIRRRRAG